jgi:hypothetical protein
MSHEGPQSDGSASDTSGDDNECGKGAYSKIMVTTFEGERCVVKAIRRYRDRSKRRRRRDIAIADEEEERDIFTEVSLLEDMQMVQILDWVWLPQIFTVAKLKDLTDDQRLAASQSLSFVPAALIYMEELQETVDDFVLRTARSSEGAEQVLRLMCE